MSNPTLSAAQFLVKPKATNLTSTSPELEIINAVINSNNVNNNYVYKQYCFQQLRKQIIINILFVFFLYRF